MINNLKVLIENKRQEIFKKNFLMNENVKIRKTQPLSSGYYILITSDLSGDIGTKETAIMGKLLNLTKDAVFPYPFKKPTYFKDNKTGRFGWGYFISTNSRPEEAEMLLSNLKTLVKDYNEKKEVEVDTHTSELNIDQLEQLDQIVQAVETTIANTESSEVKNNLEKYLIDLQNAIEDDSVFEFLIQNFEKAKSFQERNTAWKYSILNSLIVISADPTADYAGPKIYWESRNYKIKDGFEKKGILILKPSTKKRGSDIKDKVKYYKDNPGALNQFKNDKGIADTEDFSLDDPKNSYQLAKYATEKNFMGKKMVRFESVMVYTNNMVEPIPGMTPIELTAIDFAGVDDGKDKGIENTFRAILAVCVSEKVSIPSVLSNDLDNVSNLSKVVNALSMSFVLAKMNGNKSPKQEDLEIYKILAESISHIIKNHFKIKSESSKYNIANLGGDREKLQKYSNVIIKIADDLINKIKSNMNSLGENYHKLKIMIRNILNEKNV